MILKIKDSETEELSWEDVDYGAVCKFLTTDNISFVGMKVYCSTGEDMVLDLEESMLYTDFEKYKITKVFESATLVG